jgi:plastocyanin
MRMKRPFTALAVALVVPFVLTPGASARDWGVDAVDWQFIAPTTTVTAGDSVTWHFQVGGHTSTSLPNQAESWNSSATGTNSAGSSYTHVFTKPGRYQYVCIPHRDFMSGVIEVRPSADAPLVSSFRTKRRGRAVRVSFRLSRDAKVTYRLRGPSRRTIERGTLASGQHSVRVRRLRAGSYRGVLSATDGSGRKWRRSKTFRVP